MKNKLGFGFLRLPKAAEGYDWDAVRQMADTFWRGAAPILIPAIPIWTDRARRGSAGVWQSGIPENGFSWLRSCRAISANAMRMHRDSSMRS